jgi:hypothetical protein
VKLVIFLSAFFLPIQLFSGADVGALPSRDPIVVLPLLRALKGRPDFAEVEKILGHFDREIGSGRCIFIYVLRDHSEVAANSGDCVHPDWITRKSKGSPAETLFKFERAPNPSRDPAPQARIN